MSKFKSLREYLDFVERKGLLSRIDDADWNLEIGALTELVAFSSSPKALLFDSIKDYEKGYRVATNLYILPSFQAAVYGLPENLSGVELVELWREKEKSLKPNPPREVSDGPVREIEIEGADIDIKKFPSPMWHENDGGRFFGTGDVCVTRDPDSGWVNLGAYRSQVFDRDEVGINIAPDHHGRLILNKYWAKEKPMPIAIIAGQDPYTYAGACSQLPSGQSELDFAGALAEEPIDVIIEEETQLPIPATAEIAVIGHVPVNVERKEGPFGECKGYYAGGGPRPVVKIDKIWHRHQPILQGNPTMHGSAFRHALGAQFSTSARIWDSIEREIPNIRGVYTLYQQCQAGAEMTVVSLKQSYPGHWKHAALAVLGVRAGIMYNREVVIVDEDINPSSEDEVMFALMTRCEPAEDIEVIHTIPTHASDPEISPEKRSKKDFTSSTMIVNACRPYAWKDQYPKVNRVNDELKTKMIKKWGSVLNLTKN